MPTTTTKRPVIKGHRPRPERSRRGGFALLSAATLMAIVLAGGALLVSYLVNTRKAAKKYEVSVISNDIAEAGINKAVFCLNAAEGSKCGGTFGAAYTGESNVTFEGGKFTVGVSGSGATRNVTATGTTTAGQIKVIKVSLTNDPVTTDPGFDYSMQSGSGGLSMDNGATITGGPVQSGASLDCGGEEISGPVYVSAVNGVINDCDVGGDAHADRVTNNKMNGHDVYYKTANTGNTGVGSAYGGQATPNAPTGPTLDPTYWHDAAAAGGTFTGDKTQSGGSIGPLKITGNLTINGTVTLNGPLWVGGTVNFGINAVLQLNSGFGANSTVVTAGGVIAIANNANITGSGDIHSFILMHTASSADPAIDISNNCTGAIFFAPNGGISLKNNAQISAAAGLSVDMSPNTAINYDNAYRDASNVLLTTVTVGPWRIVPGTWREAR